MTSLQYTNLLFRQCTYTGWQGVLQLVRRMQHSVIDRQMDSLKSVLYVALHNLIQLEQLTALTVNH